MNQAKADVAQRLLQEVVDAQRRPLEKPRGSPIPPMLWVGDGRAIKASYRAYDLVNDYAALCAQEDDTLSLSVLENEVSDAVGSAIADILIDQDLNNLPRDSEKLVDEIESRVRKSLDRKRSSLSYYSGCTFVRGVEVPRIQIGPVAIESRQVWLAREQEEGRLSAISARRIGAKWQGKRTRPRKNIREASNERAIIDAIDMAPFVCSVKTGNLSIKTAAPKALLAARLALSALPYFGGRLRKFSRTCA